MTRCPKTNRELPPCLSCSPNLYTMLPTVLLGLLTVTQACNHLASFKSFDSADRECSHYLGHQHRCAVRCRGLVTRFLNRTSVLPTAVIERFYEPGEDDYLYRSRTTQCLRDVRALNSCELARRSVQCYDGEFGAVDRDALQFVPLTDVQHLRVVRECEAMLRESLTEGCLLRCVLIREGLYSDRDGPRVERIAVMGSDLGEDVKLWTAGPCVARLQAEKVDKCTIAARIVSECLELVVELRSTHLLRKLS
uniref:General odorant-binding protein 45 n=1 Tax=Culex pipiens TaxID=7175 RepID=A0A8D8KCH2_CULPI